MSLLRAFKPPSTGVKITNPLLYQLNCAKSLTTTTMASASHHHHPKLYFAPMMASEHMGLGFADKRNRNPNWTDHEIIRFLEILQEEKVLKDLLAQRNKQVRTSYFKKGRFPFCKRPLIDLVRRKGEWSTNL